MADFPKKLSRRDAIKLLGAAAGATLLANLPSKWSKPSLTSGVLPAHAQTSGSVSFSSVPNSPVCGGQPFGMTFTAQQNVVPVTFQAQLAPQFVGFSVNYQLVTQNVGLNIPVAGQVLSGPSGVIALNLQATIQDTPNQLQNTFTAPTASCVQTVQFIELGS